MSSDDRLASQYDDIVSGRIAPGFSVIDFLIRARQKIELRDRPNTETETVQFFGDYVAHSRLQGRAAFDFVEASCRFMCQVGPLEKTDFSLPKLRHELGTLVERPIHKGPIVSAPKNEFKGWRMFYSLLLEELAGKNVGYDGHVDSCQEKRLKNRLIRMRDEFGDLFMHVGQIQAWPLSKLGPPFGFRFYIYRKDPAANSPGAFVLMGARPLIAPDGLDWVPWLNPPEHLREKD